MEKIKENKILVNVVLVFFIGIYILAICPIELQNDTLFDIKCGENFVKNGIEGIDPFSIHENLKYQSHHLVPSIWLYNIYTNFGFYGIYVFEILLTVIIFLLMYKLNYIITKDKLFSYIMLYFEAFALIAFISVRAQMFSIILFLCQLIFINLLKNKNISKKQTWIIYVLLTLIPMVLMNVHSGVYLFYYIIMGVYFIASSIKDENKFATKLLVISMISFPLMLINPYGINGLTYVLKTFGNTFMDQNVQEFFPLSIKGGTVSVVFIIIILVVLATFVFSKRKKECEEVLFFLGTAFMSMLAIRHFVFFAICIPLFLNNAYEIYDRFFFKDKIKNKTTKELIGLEIVVVYILIVTGFFCSKEYEFLESKDMYPKEAVNYIKENIGKNSRILNSYNYGSYLMFNDIKVFVDARADLYTKEYNNVTIAEDGQDFVHCKEYYMDIIDKYNIEYIFVPRDSKVINFLRHDDKMEILFESEEENSIVIKMIK